MSYDAAHYEHLMASSKKVGRSNFKAAEKPKVSLRTDRDKLVARARKIQRFLSQPMFVTEVFTGREGRYVPIDETVRGFKEILEGKHDELPEQAFYMVGTIDEAVETAKKLQV